LAHSESFKPRKASFCATEVSEDGQLKKARADVFRCAVIVRSSRDVRVQ